MNMILGSLSNMQRDVVSVDVSCLAVQTRAFQTGSGVCRRALHNGGEPRSLAAFARFFGSRTLTGGALNFYEGGLTKRVLRIESESYFREGKE